MSAAGEARISVLDGLLDEVPPTDSLSSELFAVVDALDSSPTLRRALTDPNASERDRQALARSLLAGRVSDATLRLVSEAVALRWSGGRTLAAALERQAVRAELMKADAAGQLDETEDALFRFARMVESTPELRNALGDRRIGLAGRQSLVGQLLDGRVPPAAALLAKRAVAARERTFAHSIESFVNLAAEQKNRLVATVRVAWPLEPEQSRRLREALRRQVGRDVVIQEIVDPEVLGGVQVELGNEIIEGTVGSRLAEAERLFG